MSETLEESFRPLLLWLERHFTAHRFLWLLALACFLVAWNRGLDLLYGLIALVLAIVLVSWLLPWLALRRVRIDRRQQGAARAGGAVTLAYSVRTPRPCHHLVLAEKLPCSTADGAQVRHLASVRDGTAFTIRFGCDRRGVFDARELAIGSAWPFGLVELMRSRPTRCRLTVLPKTFRIRSLPVLRTDLDSIEGANTTARPASDHEFAGVREYRFGDSLRHVHWSASARHQCLIVREYESRDRPHLLVVVDARAGSDIGQAPESTFEYAVSIAGSLIEHAIEQHVGLDLYIDGQPPLALTIPPGATSALVYLERLAPIRAEGRRPFAGVVAEAMGRYSHAGALITIRNRAIRNQICADAVSGARDGHLDILINETSFDGHAGKEPDGWREEASGTHTLLVNRTSDLQGLFADD